ncbi:hypothetical protein Goshw_008625 [Gossypium schwendimanii]|uniref:LysM domain-containing protein n=1 Tax=Gossypium schwendimanii TaxID=34291 RepID=A0A7J9KWP8_GOSSC|nr:hypothetical protein [Gossypium schwendimanii]
MDPKVSQFVILLPLIFLLIVQTLNALDSSSATIPMNCTDTSRLCTSFLAFKPQGNQSLAVIQSMFDVIPQDITVEGEDSHGYIFIKKNCSCLTTSKNYATNTTFTVRSNQGYVYDMILEAYDGLAMVPNVSRPARIGAVVSLRLFCGCSSSLWNYLMSYVMKDGDSVQSLASRFGVSMDSIEQVNGISNPDNVTVGALYYIPLNSVPGEPYHVENEIPPAPVPAPSADTISEIQVSPKAHVPYGWIIGGLGVGLALIMLSIVVCVFLRSSSCFVEARGSHAKDHDDKSSHKFHILRKPSFCCGSGRYICGKSENWTQTNGEPSNHQITIPNALGTDVLDVEKPVVFTYEDILFSTDGFSDSNLLGRGIYGSVYFGFLRDQVCVFLLRNLDHMIASKMRNSDHKLTLKVFKRAFNKTVLYFIN